MNKVRGAAWIVVWVAGVFAPGAAPPATGPDAAPVCDTGPACLALLDRLPSQPLARHGGIGPQEQQLARAFARLGPAAVPQLVVRLADADTERAERAAYMLRGISPIDPRFLPQIRAGLDRGLHGLPMALAGVGTRAAIEEAVDRRLAPRPGSEDQFDSAIETLGERAAEVVLDRARCLAACPANRYERLAPLVARLGPARARVADALMDLAESTDDPQSVDGLLHLVGEAGPPAIGVEGRLLALRERRPAHAGAVDVALSGIGSPAHVRLLRERLAQHGELHVLQEIALIGPAAREAGPAVTALLDSPDRRLRLVAVRSLGMIGYEPAAPRLLELLARDDDVLQVWCAIDALRLLGYLPALPMLDALATSHWYPAVRSRARDAAAAIREGAPPKPFRDEREANHYLWDYEHAGRDVASCATLPGTPRRLAPDAKRRIADAEPLLATLAFPGEEYGAVEDPGAPSGLRRELRAVAFVPHVAVRVGGGWLTGSHRGEWGGELVFAGDDGVREKLMEANVEDLHVVDGHFLVVHGLAHLGLNSGAIDRVAPDATGRWVATFWRGLPGAPWDSHVTEAGELVIDTLGGTVVVDRQGGMHMAACSD